ncbi:hypothetical protein FGO68_gene128 [Halteria grandinella]|uniref:Uncharacterized protein n=1 Tax=Halteria grandinella TaxID=5974 RepID=A0A8J8NNN7_HALGN|nr:hypothetical protein FGO68_gene128 [Halteria grandinella]
MQAQSSSCLKVEIFLGHNDHSQSSAAKLMTSLFSLAFDLTDVECYHHSHKGCTYSQAILGLSLTSASLDPSEMTLLQHFAYASTFTISAEYTQSHKTISECARGHTNVDEVFKESPKSIEKVQIVFNPIDCTDTFCPQPTDFFLINKVDSPQMHSLVERALITCFSHQLSIVCEGKFRKIFTEMESLLKHLQIVKLLEAVKFLMQRERNTWKHQGINSFNFRSLYLMVPSAESDTSAPQAQIILQVSPHSQVNGAGSIPIQDDSTVESFGEETSPFVKSLLEQVHQVTESLLAAQEKMETFLVLIFSTQMDEATKQLMKEKLEVMAANILMIQQLLVHAQEILAQKIAKQEQASDHAHTEDPNASTTQESSLDQLGYHFSTFQIHAESEIISSDDSSSSDED